MPYPKRISVYCGTLLTMTEREPDGRQIVEIEGDRICSIHPLAVAPSPPIGNVIDLSHATVLPGLIDAHTHLGLDVIAGNEALQAQLPETEMAGAVAKLTVLCEETELGTYLVAAVAGEAPPVG